MADEGSILLLGFGDQRKALAGRVFLLRLKTAWAETLEEARETVAGGEPRAVVIHARPRFDVAGLADLGKDSPHGRLTLAVLGAQPPERQLEAFRQAGTTLCLWEPFSDGELRFVLNQALHGLEGCSRGEVRVPTDLSARVESATGEKPASVYNLSVSGAYLETMRPTSNGGRVMVELPMAGGMLRVQARVVSTNVPGNLQRPNLPMGMGVQFFGVEPATSSALAGYVEERGRAYRL